MEIATFMNIAVTVMIVILGGMWRTMNSGFAKVDARFDKVDAKFGKIDERLDDINTRLSRLEGVTSVSEPIKKIKG